MILEGLTISIFLVIFAIATIVIYPAFTEVNSDVQDQSDISAPSKAKINSLHERYPSVMDGLFVLAFALMWGGALVMSFMVDSHPIFFIFAVLLLVILLFVGAELSNMYDELTTDPEIGNTSFPMTTYIMNHLVAFILAVATTTGIVLYGKNRYAS